MAIVFSTLIILASILLIVVVFVQNPKGGGLSTDFGAAHQLGGVQRTNDFIEKATWSLAAGIMVFSIALTIIKTPDADRPGSKQQTEQPGGQNGGQPGTQPGGQPAGGNQTR